MIDKQVDHEKIKWKMKLDYSHAAADRTHKALEGIQGLVTLINKPNVNQHDFLQNASDLIAKLFRLRSVTIGLRSPDGLFRYEVMSGLREEAWAFQKSLAYEEKDFLNSEVYKGEMISKMTKLFLAEDAPFPETEKEAFNRPFVLGLKRRGMEDWIEGDYLDVMMRSADGQLIGWMEVVGTIDGKLPDVTSIKWMEAIATVVGTRIETKRH
jgi:hypothetical protein